MNDPNIFIGALNLLVAFLGVLFVILTIYEWRSLSKLRNEFGDIITKMKRELYQTQKAMQRVIASYGIQDVDKRITLLSEAVETDPTVFNGFNSLGYAYLEKNEIQKAIDAFRAAIETHPDDKAGYFDMAYACLKAGDEDLAVKYLVKAIKKDPSSAHDLKSGAGQMFGDLLKNEKLMGMMH